MYSYNHQLSIFKSFVTAGFYYCNGTQYTMEAIYVVAAIKVNLSSAVSILIEQLSCKQGSMDKFILACLK